MSDKRVDDHDPLEQAVEALRQTRVPLGPNEALIQRTLMQAGAGEIRNVYTGKGWLTMKMMKRSAMAAALVLVIGGVTVAGLRGRGAGVAFADVVEEVKAAKVVQCKVDIGVEVPGMARTLTTMEMLMSEDGIANMAIGTTRSVVDEARGRIMVIDDEHKEVIVLDEQGTKQADRGEAAVPNLLTQFKQMNGEGRLVGEKEIDGKKTKCFLMEKGRTSLFVWADEGTRRPVLVVMIVAEEKSPAVQLPAVQFTFREFDWDPKKVTTMTKFEVPEGYKEVSR